MISMLEIWKEIPLTSKYLVSNFGNVKNSNTGKVLKGSINNNGYMRFDLCLNGHRIVRFGHRLVAEAFLSPDPERPYVNHKDGNKANNVITNLEWCTCKENSIHAFHVLLRVPHNARPVRCLETGVVYDSCNAAERALGISNTLINRCCRGVRKSTHKMHFEFA